MFNLHNVSIKLKSVYLCISVVLLASGCALFDDDDDDKVGYRSVYDNFKIIRLSDELSAEVYKVLNSETPNNAFAKQPHTMGDMISGKLICDNEFVDGSSNATEQRCRIFIDVTDRGAGG